MTRIERLREALAKAETERNQWIYTNHTLIPPQRLTARVETLRNQLRQEESLQPQRLCDIVDKKTLDQSGVPEMIIKLHLAADFLADCGFSLRTAMNSLGLADCSLYPYVDRITSASSELAGIVCKDDLGDLAKLIVSDDRLLQTLHRNVGQYMTKKLNLIKSS